MTVNYQGCILYSPDTLNVNTDHAGLPKDDTLLQEMDLRSCGQLASSRQYLFTGFDIKMKE